MSTETLDAAGNGTAYDIAELDLSGIETIELPATSSVTILPGAQKYLAVYLAKDLGFGGIPPAVLTVLQARAYMGCAYRESGDLIAVATFGEWSSFEGGAEIRLRFVVSADVRILLQSTYSGPDSEANISNPEERMSRALKLEREHGTWWYGTTVPAIGWRPITSRADGKWRERWRPRQEPAGR